MGMLFHSLQNVLSKSRCSGQSWTVVHRTSPVLAEDVDMFDLSQVHPASQIMRLQAGLPLITSNDTGVTEMSTTRTETSCQQSRRPHYHRWSRHSQHVYYPITCQQHFLWLVILLNSNYASAQWAGGIYFSVLSVCSSVCPSVTFFSSAFEL